MLKITTFIPAHEETTIAYEFSELNEEAKRKAKEWELNGREAFLFSADVAQDMDIIFPNSYMKVQHSLNYCQGDGLNVYGRLAISDMVELLKREFNEKELRCLAWVADTVGYFELKENRRYCYCKAYCYDFIGMIEDGLYGMKNIPHGLLKRFATLVADYIEDYCSRWERIGYEYFYEISDEEMEEVCEIHGYMFDECGEFVGFAEQLYAETVANA